jgi:hypothetical protein
VTDLDDLRRRAAQHAGYGHYWAGKCVALIDRLVEAERQRDEARHALALTADPEVAYGIGWAECPSCDEAIVFGRADIAVTGGEGGTAVVIHAACAVRAGSERGITHDEFLARYGPNPPTGAEST